MHDHEMFSWMMNSDSNWLNPSFKTSGRPPAFAKPHLLHTSHTSGQVWPCCQVDKQPHTIRKTGRLKNHFRGFPTVMVPNSFSWFSWKVLTWMIYDLGLPPWLRKPPEPWSLIRAKKTWNHVLNGRDSSGATYILLVRLNVIIRWHSQVSCNWKLSTLLKLAGSWFETIFFPIPDMMFFVFSFDLNICFLKINGSSLIIVSKLLVVILHKHHHAYVSAIFSSKRRCQQTQQNSKTNK